MSRPDPGDPSKPTDLDRLRVLRDRYFEEGTSANKDAAYLLEQYRLLDRIVRELERPNPLKDEADDAA